jgi:hypothetical protein
MVKRLAYTSAGARRKEPSAYERGWADGYKGRRLQDGFATADADAYSCGYVEGAEAREEDQGS